MERPRVKRTLREFPGADMGIGSGAFGWRWTRDTIPTPCCLQVPVPFLQPCRFFDL